MDRRGPQHYRQGRGGRRPHTPLFQGATAYPRKRYRPGMTIRARIAVTVFALLWFAWMLCWFALPFALLYFLVSQA